MSEIINAFNNSWGYVQIFRLLALIACIAIILGGPIWLAHRWLTMRRKLPADVMLALRQEGDTLTLSVRQGAPVTRQQVVALLEHGEVESGLKRSEEVSH